MPGSENTPSRPSRARGGILPAALTALLLLGGGVGCASHLKTLRDSTPINSGGGDDAFLGQAYFHYLQALDREREGDLEGALNHLRQALVFDPKSHQVMTRTSVILEQMGHAEDALSMAQQALERAPEYVPALAQLAHLYAFNGQFEAAKEVLKQAISLAPGQQDLYLELARLHRREGDQEAALAVLDDYATRTPRVSVYNMSLKAIILRELGRNEEAEEAYVDLMSTYPWVEQARRELTELLLATGGPEYAAQRLERLFDAEPWQDWIPAALVDLYASQGDIDALERQLEALEIRTESFRALRFGAAQDLITAGEFESAETLLTPALAFTGDDGDTAHFLYAQLALTQGEYALAAERFKDVPPSSEHFSAALIRRAYALGKLDRSADAIDEMEAYLKAHPESPEALYALGLIYEDGERHADALRVLDVLITVEPGNVDAYAQRAGALQALGRTEEAIASLDTALKAMPSDTRLYRLKAAIHQEERQYGAAIDALKAGLKRDADSFDLRYQLAVMLDLDGQKHEAIAQMKILLQAFPDDPDILNFIGYTYSELGERLPEAEMMIRQALESDPENGYILDSLGWIFYKQAEYAKAVETLEQAVRLSDREPIITEHLGDAYLKVGRDAEALSIFRYALEALQSDEGANPADLSRLQEKIEHLSAEGVVAQGAKILAE